MESHTWSIEPRHF